MLSKACTYGLLASFYVAKAKGSDYVSIRQMSDDLGISFHFLTKILQKLTSAGIMASHKGPKGGVSMGRNPATISLLDIITAIDGPELLNECILGLKGCGHERPCPMHNRWLDIRNDLTKLFTERNLANASEEILNLNLRLA